MDWGPIKQRLKLAATVRDMNDSEFARSIGMAVQAWFNIHGGPNTLKVEIALDIRRIHGFTLEWIYCGELSQLPSELRDKILELERRSAPPKAKGPRKPRVKRQPAAKRAV